MSWYKVDGRDNKLIVTRTREFHYNKDKYAIEDVERLAVKWFKKKKYIDNVVLYRTIVCTDWKTRRQFTKRTLLKVWHREEYKEALNV